MRKGGNLERLTKILEHGCRYSIERSLLTVLVLSVSAMIWMTSAEKRQRGEDSVFDTQWVLPMSSGRLVNHEN